VHSSLLCDTMCVSAAAVSTYVLWAGMYACCLSAILAVKPVQGAVLVIHCLLCLHAMPCLWSMPTMIQLNTTARCNQLLGDENCSFACHDYRA
jgi:hypothetical protein